MSLKFVCLWFLIGVASGARKVRKNNRTESSGFGGTAQRLWDAYVASVTGEARTVTPGFQQTCEPKKYWNEGLYKGTIMLFHGYTACPQQFDRLVPILTKRGYMVLTPTLPGFGYQYHLTDDGKIEDYINDMPTTKEEYQKYGDQMVAIMNAVGSGSKLIFGHSLGGAVASYVNYHGKSYTRALIAAPMIRVSGILDAVLLALSQGEILKNFRAGWGEPCEIERSMGRHGVCQFTPLNGIAGRDFGSTHRAEVTIPAKPGSVQIIFVEDDGAVSPQGVRDLAQSYGIGGDSEYICGMDAALGHSFMSPYDNPTQDKYWLSEVTLKVADFLTKGTVFSQSGRIDEYPRCDLTSTP